MERNLSTCDLVSVQQLVDIYKKGSKLKNKMKCIMAYENDAGHQDISNQITDMYVT